MVNAESLKLFKQGSVLINTGRGALIDTAAVIPGAEVAGDRSITSASTSTRTKQGLFFEDWTARSSPTTSSSS
jgi:hypothetical protein